MRLLLIIGSGSFIGGIMRYLSSQFFQSKFLSAFPFGTLGVNIIGCFLIGIIFGASEKINLSSETRLFLATGICGGFTTLSAFSQETISLFRDRGIFYSGAYISASGLPALLATII